jgi:ABC-type multidrug transport system ATPase subunit
MAVIELVGVNKSFGRSIHAVRDLDLQISEGETYGLLGPNGAGKSTVLRLLMGLSRPSSGTVLVLGAKPGRPASLRQTGFVGEQGFYPFLSGRDNLRTLARRIGIGDRDVDAALERLGLGARARDAYGGYSLGMRKRLEIAAALMKRPQVLLLDEPSNGLDPVGQLQIRELIQELATDGRTILLSSHDMEEVESLCGRVGILGGGRLLAEGTPDALRGEHFLRVVVNRVQEAARVVSELPGIAGVERSDGGLVVSLVSVGPHAAAAVGRALMDAGLEVSELRLEQAPLRDVFMRLTGGRTGGADSLVASASDAPAA